MIAVLKCHAFMSSDPSPSHAIVEANNEPPRGFVLWLSIAQLISWGTLFYTFSLLLEHFERDLSLTRVDASIAFSLALLCEGLLAFLIGRMIDAGRARAVMCTGSALAACAFVAMAFVQTQWQLYAAWIVAGIAMSGTLYAPAFAILIRRYPQSYRRAIITLTFLGGLASTVFIPLSAFFIAQLGWRNALLVLASLHVLICLPIHAYWLRNEPAAQSHEHAQTKSLGHFAREFPFWGLAVFFVLFSGITSAIGTHMVPILSERDLPVAWVIAIPASIGVLQVIGRLILYVTEKHIDVHAANRWIPATLPAALFVLALGFASPIAALLFALLYGLANGMITIVKATAMAQYVSRERAASLNGLLGLPTAIVRAIAPSALAVLWTLRGDYQFGLGVLTAIGVIAVASFWIAQRRAIR
jgi:predicted MFS family arabinose efflux permease